MGINNIIDAIKRYINIEIDLVKLEARENFVEVLSSMIIFMLFMALGLMLLLFLSLAAAFYLNEVCGSSYLGFLIVTAFYLLLTIVLLLFKDQLVTSSIIKSIFGKSLVPKEKEKNHE